MESNQAVLDADGYAQCPDCGTRIHCGTVGLANLEKRHRGKKICLETKAKRDKNMKTKKNRTLLSFFNQPKTSLVPSTIPAIQPVLSPALPQEENTLAKYPHWDQSPRRLKLPALSRESKEIPDSADHIKPSSWRGNVKVKEVSLQTSWNRGRRLVEDECTIIKPILTEMETTVEVVAARRSMTMKCK